jgi:hypothetical protein
LYSKPLNSRNSTKLDLAKLTKGGGAREKRLKRSTKTSKNTPHIFRTSFTTISPRPRFFQKHYCFHVYLWWFVTIQNIFDWTHSGFVTNVWLF